MTAPSGADSPVQLRGLQGVWRCRCGCLLTSRSRCRSFRSLQLAGGLLSACLALVVLGTPGCFAAGLWFPVLALGVWQCACIGMMAAAADPCACVGAHTTTVASAAVFGVGAALGQHVTNGRQLAADPYRRAGNCMLLSCCSAFVALHAFYRPLLAFPLL